MFHIVIAAFQRLSSSSQALGSNVPDSKRSESERFISDTQSSPFPSQVQASQSRVLTSRSSLQRLPRSTAHVRFSLPAAEEYQHQEPSFLSGYFSSKSDSHGSELGHESSSTGRKHPQADDNGTRRSDVRPKLWISDHFDDPSVEKEDGNDQGNRGMFRSSSCGSLYQDLEYQTPTETRDGFPSIELEEEGSRNDQRFSLGLQVQLHPNVSQSSDVLSYSNPSGIEDVHRHVEFEHDPYPPRKRRH